MVIPTYNRADLLDRQLTWLHGELTRLDESWEVRIHDNCSTDSTPEVSARWQQAFGADRFHVVRNTTNIRGIPNLGQAIAAAHGTWVWSVGDDDRIYDGATRRIVELLHEEPDLALLYLNYRGVDSETGATTIEHYFNPSVSGRLEDGRSAFAFHAAAELGSVIFLTATVCRTALVHEAQRSWTGEVNNWALMGYWTGYVCARGPIHITAENWIDCVVGTSHWQDEDGAWTRAAYEEIPRVFLELEQEGYDPKFCRHEGLKGPRELAAEAGYRAHLRALKHCPRCVFTLTHLFLAGRWSKPRVSGPRPVG